MTADNDYLVGRIRQALAEDPRVNKQDIRVEVLDKRVHLFGDTSTEERRAAISEVVSEVAPDLEIRNEIAVRRVDVPIVPEVI